MDNHNSGWNPPRAQYPWKQGDELFADELNAAIAAASSGVAAGGPFLPLSGAIPMTGPLTLSGNATLPLHPVPLQQVTSAVAAAPFLPLSGATPMTGPLTLSGNATLALHAVPLQQLNTAVSAPITATGSTTPRSAQDRAADVVNVKDFGAKGDGVTNDLPAIKAAVAHSGAIYFPKGRYYVNGTYCIIQPNTRIYGDGPGQSVIVPDTMTGGHQDPTFGYIFVSQNYDTFGAFTTTPTTPSVQTDVNISIEGLGFDLSNSFISGKPINAICRFLWASNVRIRNIRADNYTVNTAPGYVGFAFLGCDNFSVDSFYARNVLNAIDQWKGCSRAKHSRLWLEQVNNGGNGGLVNWQGVGTVTTDTEASIDLQVSDSTFWTNSGVALFLDAQSAGSVANNVLLTNLVISARTGTVGQGIVARGLVNSLMVRGVVFSAAPGADFLPVLLGGYVDPTAAGTGANLITTTNGSASVVVSYVCRCGVGNYLTINNGSGGPVAGNGVSLFGSYLITAVNSGAGTYTVLTTTPATGSGSLAGATSVTGYYGATSNATLSDITIDGCSAGGGWLIVAHGQGHAIDNVVVTPNYQGASNPAYNAIVSIDTTESVGIASPAPCYVGGIVGAAGSGSLAGGYTGNNVVTWRSAGIAPTTIAVVTQPQGTQNTTIATTAFAVSTLYATATTLPDANTTLTAAQAGSRFLNLTGTLTAQRTITMPVAGLIRNWTIRNATTQNLGIVGSSGSTAWLPPSCVAEVWTDGANILTGGNATLATTFRVGDATRNSLVTTIGAAPTNALTLNSSGSGGIQFNSNVGFNSTAPLTKPSIAGSRSGNAALADLLTKLAATGLIADTTTA